MINCPIDISLICNECRYNTDKKCWWFFPAKHLVKILTPEERLEELEAQSPPEQVIIHRNSSMSKQDWDLLQQTSRRSVNLEKAVNEHLRPKPKRKPKYS